MFPVLETKRLILRELTEFDTKVIFSILSEYQKEGILRSYIFQNGVSNDVYVYSILNESLNPVEATPAN